MSTFEQRLNRSSKGADLPPTPRHSGVLRPGSVRGAQDGEGGVPDGDRAISDLAWSMFSSIAAGILLYGGLGWLLDRWLGLDALFLPIGVILGAGLGTYIVFVRASRATIGERHH